MMRDHDTALETHAREELGINPGQLGDPPKAAVSSFFAFSVGAFVPLLPWFFRSGNGAVVASIILGGVAAAVIGAALARFTGRPALWSAARQVLIAAMAAGITYAVGRAVGVRSPT
jgi:VIT1/CCC1 family predicted Fe2+/Mn2+ transporter